MHILTVRNNSNPQTAEAALLLASYCAANNIRWSCIDYSDLEGAFPHPEVHRLLEEGLDLIVVLGGDGSILRAARQVGQLQVPILGVNYGRMGFLANSSENGLLHMLGAALADEVSREFRTNLSVKVVCEGDPDEDNQALPSLPAERSFFALNEVAIERNASGRSIDCALRVNDIDLMRLRGNGLIVATPTGSTAYALSAGGPLVAPSVNGLVVVPMAPHTLAARPIVTGGSDVVEVVLPPSFPEREPVLFVDGEALTFEQPLRRVYICKGSAPTVLLRYENEGFYEHAAEEFFPSKKPSPAS